LVFRVNLISQLKQRARIQQFPFPVLGKACKQLSGSMFKLVGLLRNRNFILSLALALGLLLGQGARWTERLVLPALAFVMMLSTTSVTGSLFRSPRKLLAPLLTGARAQERICSRVLKAMEI